MMRIYRVVLMIFLVMAIGFGVWYCVYSYDEQRSTKDGTLVLEEGAWNEPDYIY